MLTSSRTRIFAIGAAFSIGLFCNPYDADAQTREEILDRLLSERESPELLETAIDAARTAGIGEQGILEARFLFHVDRREDDQLAALAPEFLKRRESFRVEDSEIFATREDWLAVVEYLQALAALQNDDAAAFKKHITEAFWLSPRQGAAFAPHIDRLRLAEAMEQVRIDFEIKLAPLKEGDATAISSHNEKAVATLLHFWSPWSRECEVTMPEFMATATLLAQHDIAVVSILPEQSPEVRTEALELIAPLSPTPPGAWMVDRPKNPLSRLLRIQNVPAMVLLAPDGSVLFNGHPTDDALWKALEKLAPTMARPPAPKGIE